MSDVRVVVVDDEPLVRRGIATFLEAEPDVELVAEATNGIEAVEVIEAQRPDVVFLDVQMPEMDGFEVLRQVAGAEMPAIVFVTAYDQYAIRAFDVHAVDYLLKPFDEGRLRVALARARSRISRASPDLAPRITELLRTLLDDRPRMERLMVRSAGRVYFVDVVDVDWFEAADNYVRLHVGGRKHLIRDTITNLEHRLAPERFIRIHRSAILNISRMREMRPLPSGDCDIVLKDGTSVRLSRSYREAFQRRVSAGQA